MQDLNNFQIKKYHMDLYILKNVKAKKIVNSIILYLPIIFN